MARRQQLARRLPEQFQSSLYIARWIGLINGAEQAVAYIAKVCNGREEVRVVDEPIEILTSHRLFLRFGRVFHY